MADEPSMVIATEIPTAHSRKLFVGGMITTVLYVAGLAIYAYWVRQAMLKMTPDQFATFLSGVFAPLAFLWLVLGFRQQGDELQNSANALWLQGEELRNSVEQQRQLVEVSRDQLAAEYAERQRVEEEADRAAQPQFIMPKPGGSYSGPMRDLTITATSAGPTCSLAVLLIDGEVRSERHLLRENDRIDTKMSYSRPDDVRTVTATIAYTDRRGNRRGQSFWIPVDETGGPGGDRTLGEPMKLPGYEKLDLPQPSESGEG